MGSHRFETELLLAGGNNTGIEVPPEVVEALGAGKRPAVVVTVNGFEYRSTIASMGGKYLIPFSSDKRATTGLGAGDPIVVELVHDAAPRTVEVPDDLAAALEAAGARAAFDRLAPSHRKAHVTAIEQAKAAETRRRRIEKAVAQVLGG
ncbi:YdeI/OmpD-associated family protein [Agromyces sp. MMS24-JH15]|uniref:YdeI/OmpD-associated family protein n=1 Tax=Agromyces sp. MMS24-JH15 TaxID=3243765 RepID=UPI003748E7B9